MKKVNIIIAVILMLCGVFIGYNASNNEINNVISTKENKTNNTQYDGFQTALYDDIIKESYTATKVYNTSELTTEILTNRNGKIIIEKVVGKVENDELDGKILNCGNKGDYISYKVVDGVKKNDTVLTYFIYNPLTNITDDVLTRIDFIIDGNTI